MVSILLLTTFSPMGLTSFNLISMFSAIKFFLWGMILTCFFKFSLFCGFSIQFPTITSKTQFGVMEKKLTRRIKSFPMLFGKMQENSFLHFLNQMLKSYNLQSQFFWEIFHITWYSKARSCSSIHIKIWTFQHWISKWEYMMLKENNFHWVLFLGRLHLNCSIDHHSNNISNY